MVGIAFTAMVQVQAASLLWGGAIGNSLEPVDWFCGSGTKMWLIYLGDGTSGPWGAPTDFNISTGLTNLGGVVRDTYNPDASELGEGLAEAQTPFLDEGIINGWYMVTIWDPVTSDRFGYYNFQVSGLGDSNSPGRYTLFGWTTSGVDFHDAAMLPIPEPTAMALLALGAAAVGLRRRFRK